MSQPDDLAPTTRLALDEALRTLRADRDHGASWLARLVATALRDAASTVTGSSDEDYVRLLTIHAAARDFAAARPSMATVANTAARMWAAAVSVGEPTVTLDRLRDEARSILDGEHSWAQSIRELIRPLLTGPLFTLSRSGTVERALMDLLPDLPDAAHEIYIAESRPGGEGIATARALAAVGWRVTLVADAAIGAYMPRCTLALVGADSILASGLVVNKIGTYLLALAARDSGIPTYAACETLKIAALSFPVVFEEMDPAEILPEVIPGITVRNRYFEATPTRLFNGIITERGVLTHDDIVAEAFMAEEALTSLQRPWTPA